MRVEVLRDGDHAIESVTLSTRDGIRPQRLHADDCVRLAAELVVIPDSVRCPADESRCAGAVSPRDLYGWSGLGAGSVPICGTRGSRRMARRATGEMRPPLGSGQVLPTCSTREPDSGWAPAAMVLAIGCHLAGLV